jgi:hypothetical protein
MSFGLCSQGTKEKEDLMDHQDFQGSMDNMVGMDMLEKKGIQDPQYVKFSCCRILLNYMVSQVSIFPFSVYQVPTQ